MWQTHFRYHQLLQSVMSCFYIVTFFLYLDQNQNHIIIYFDERQITTDEWHLNVIIMLLHRLWPLQYAPSAQLKGQDQTSAWNSTLLKWLTNSTTWWEAFVTKTTSGTLQYNVLSPKKKVPDRHTLKTKVLYFFFSSRFLLWNTHCEHKTWSQRGIGNTPTKT